MHCAAFTLAPDTQPGWWHSEWTIGLGSAIAGVLLTFAFQAIVDRRKDESGVQSLRDELYATLSEIWTSTAQCVLTVKDLSLKADLAGIDSVLQKYQTAASLNRFDEQLRKIKRERGKLQKEVDSFAAILDAYSSAGKQQGNWQDRIRALGRLFEVFEYEQRMHHISDDELRKQMHVATRDNLEESLRTLIDKGK